MEFLEFDNCTPKQCPCVDRTAESGCGKSYELLNGQVREVPDEELQRRRDEGFGAPTPGSQQRPGQQQQEQEKLEQEQEQEEQKEEQKEQEEQGQGKDEAEEGQVMPAKVLFRSCLRQSFARHPSLSTTAPCGPTARVWMRKTWQRI